MLGLLSDPRPGEEKRPPQGGPGRLHTGAGNRRQGALGAFGR